MSKKMIITGDGTIGDDPKNGHGVQHYIPIGEEVQFISNVMNKNSVIERVEVRTKEGKVRMVMPNHIDEIF